MVAHRLDPQLVTEILSLINATARANPDLPVRARGNKNTVTALVAAHYRARGVPAGTIDHRIIAVMERYPEQWALACRGALMDAAPVTPVVAAQEATPVPRPEPRTLEGDVELQRARSTASEARSRLKDAQAKIAELEDRVREYETAFRSTARPAEWTIAPRMGEPSEHIPELLTSDFQIGEVIRPEETDAAHGYDVETFRRRYRRLIETTIRLCFDHGGAGWRYPGIVYARGGDTISGGIHDELAETDELTPVEAVELAFEEEAAGIQRLLDAFGRVDIKDAGGGNHDRDTHKPRTKRATGHSFDRLVSYMLRREFMRDDRVTFQGTLSPDVYFPIYETRILLTHGDKIGSRGGMGMVGPAATISRGFQKVILEQQALGRAVDMVQCGHFHTPLWLETGICNGCLPGYSEYAKSNRLRPQPPSQFLMFFAPRRGLVDVRKVFVEDPLPASALDLAA